MRLTFREAIVVFAAWAAFGTLAWAQAGPSGPDEGRARQRGQQRDRDRDQDRNQEHATDRPEAAPPDAPRPTIDRIFNALDADGDGKIDKREMAQKGKGLLERLQAQRPAPGAAAPGVQPRPERPGATDRPALRRGQGMGARGQAFQGRARGAFQSQGRGMNPGHMRREGRGFGKDQPCPMCRREQRGRGAYFGPARPLDREMQGSAFQPFGGGRGMGGMPGPGMQGFRAPGAQAPDRGGVRPTPQTLRMLDSNGNGRLEAPEIRSKIEMLERLLGRAEREPIELPGPGPLGPPRP